MKDGPESIAEILARLFLQRSWGGTQRQHRLAEAWAKAAGPEIAKKTEPLALRRGIMEVAVADGILLQELANFRKKALLAALQKALESETVKDIRFRTGR